MNTPLDPGADPKAALLTPRGRGAIASLRCWGAPQAIEGRQPRFFAAANGRQLSDQPIDRIVFGRWGDAPGEEVVVCRIDEVTTEIHCHGGDAAIRRILADLESAGFKIVSWQELETARVGEFDAECRDALARAPTLRAAGVLLEQSSGTLRRAIEDLLAHVQCGDAIATATRIEALLAWARFGLHLSRPWQVAIVGRPNVGKSRLLNALAGYERAIVFDEPGTTRDLVTAEVALQGWPVTLIDTAGIRNSDSPLESAGIEMARAQAQSADLRLIVLDASQPPTSDDLDLLATWPDALIAANKSDLPDAWGDRLPAPAMRLSALTGAGTEGLAEKIADALVPDVPAPDVAVPVTARQVALLSSARDAAIDRDWTRCADLVTQILGRARAKPVAPRCTEA